MVYVNTYWQPRADSLESAYGIRNDARMFELINGDGSYRFWNLLANFLLACKKRRTQFVECYQ